MTEDVAWETIQAIKDLGITRNQAFEAGLISVSEICELDYWVGVWAADKAADEAEQDRLEWERYLLSDEADYLAERAIQYRTTHEAELWEAAHGV
jgi:hypothetical protein